MSEPEQFDNSLLDQALKEKVPSGDVEIDMPEDSVESSEDKIEVANEDTLDLLRKSVTERIIDAYTKAETERSARQVPLFLCISWLTIGQLIAFNLIIAATGVFSFLNSNIEVIFSFFEICKYYIGAVIVELIGMLAFIMKGTFSSKHIDMMKLVVEGLPVRKKKIK